MNEMCLLTGLLLTTCQAIDQCLRSLVMECASRVDDDVILRGDPLQEFGVVQAAELNGIDALASKHIGLFWFSDQGGDFEIFNIGVR